MTRLAWEHHTIEAAETVDIYYVYLSDKVRLSCVQSVFNERVTLVFNRLGARGIPGTNLPPSLPPTPKPKTESLKYKFCGHGPSVTNCCNRQVFQRERVICIQIYY